MRKTLLLFFLSSIFIFSSCTINKRVYRKGIYIEHKEQNKKSEKQGSDNKPTIPSQKTSVTKSDSIVTDDQHTLVEDSIQKTIPLSDTVSVVDNGKKHHVADSREISIGGNNKTHTTKNAEHQKNSPHKKSHHKKPPKHHDKKNYKDKHPSHHEKQKDAHHEISSIHIPFLGWLVYWLSWLSWILLLTAAFLAKYLPLQTGGEWFLLFAILCLSATFALLSLLLIPLAKKFDSQHSSLIHRGVKNLKIISVPLIILLLISGGMVALYFFL